MDLARKNLLKKALDQKLGHFFMVTPPGRAKDSKKGLMQWILKFVSEYFKAHGIAFKDPKNNEDLLIIDESLVKKKFYEIEFVDQIARFLSHAPVGADRKFVVIEDMERMSPIHLNKLLKTFEEPPVNATIFLLNPSLAKPMATVASRAVSLRAPIAVQQEPKDLEAWKQKLEKKNLHQFCDYFKTREEDEKNLVQALLDNFSPDTRPDLLLKLQDYLVARNYDTLYNHNNYARLTLLREIYLAAEASANS